MFLSILVQTWLCMMQFFLFLFCLLMTPGCCFLFSHNSEGLVLWNMMMRGDCGCWLVALYFFAAMTALFVVAFLAYCCCFLSCSSMLVCLLACGFCDAACNFTAFVFGQPLFSFCVVLLCYRDVAMLACATLQFFFSHFL